MGLLVGLEGSYWDKVLDQWCHETQTKNNRICIMFLPQSPSVPHSPAPQGIVGNI